MDSASDVNGATTVTPPPTQGQPVALTTDEPTSVPPSMAHDKRVAAEEESPHPPNVGRNPPPVPPPLAAGRRITSPGGGVQVTLDGKGSWSELARQDATLPTDANCVDGSKQESSGGMFGFLRSKKSRAHSPKPKERGVLGKEGARVVIG